MPKNNSDSNVLDTPPHLRGSVITDLISNFTRNLDQDPSEEAPNDTAMHPKYLKLTPTQLSQLLQACSSPSVQAPNLHGSPTSIIAQPTLTPAYFNNAKYEDICCKPIKPCYDGTETDLMPFLLLLDIRHQDKGWAPATYVTIASDTSIRYELTCGLALVAEADIIAAIQDRWSSPTVQTDKHTIGHITCHARLLAKCLLASISNELTMTLMNHIPTAYCNDGTYMLWAITNNNYRNNIAFVECIREKIAMATLAVHDNNVERYLIFIENTLRMIIAKPSSGKKFNGLITYILRQLKGTTNSIFLCFIQDLHVQYQEDKLPKFNPMKLILDVEDKIRVLKHAEVWDMSSPSQEIPAMALNTTPAITDQLKDFLANHITAELKRLINSLKSPSPDNTSGLKDGKTRSRFQHQDWMFVPPSRLSDTKTVQGRTYNWCT